MGSATVSLNPSNPSNPGSDNHVEIPRSARNDTGLRREKHRPLRLRKGTRTSEAMFAGMPAPMEKHPPSPLTLREGGRFLARLGMTQGYEGGDSSLRSE